MILEAPVTQTQQAVVVTHGREQHAAQPASDQGGGVASLVRIVAAVDGFEFDAKLRSEHLADDQGTAEAVFGAAV